MKFIILNIFFYFALVGLLAVFGSVSISNLATLVEVELFISIVQVASNCLIVTLFLLAKDVTHQFINHQKILPLEKKLPTFNYRAMKNGVYMLEERGLFIRFKKYETVRNTGSDHY